MSWMRRNAGGAVPARGTRPAPFRRLAIVLLAGCGWTAAASAQADPGNAPAAGPWQIDAFLTAASDRLADGLTQTGGQAGLEAGLLAEWRERWFAGALLAQIEYDYGPFGGGRRGEEFVAYAGRRGSLGPVSWDGRIARYFYRDDAVRKPYWDLALGVHLNDDLSIVLSRRIDAAVALDDGGSVGLRARRHLGSRITAGGGVGYRYYPYRSWNYLHADFGLSVMFGPFTADLRATTTLDDADYFYTRINGGTRLVLSLSIGT